MIVSSRALRREKDLHCKLGGRMGSGIGLLIFIAASIFYLGGALYFLCISRFTKWIDKRVSVEQDYDSSS